MKLDGQHARHDDEGNRRRQSHSCDFLGSGRIRRPGRTFRTALRTAAKADQTTSPAGVVRPTQDWLDHGQKDHRGKTRRRLRQLVVTAAASKAPRLNYGQLVVIQSNRVAQHGVECWSSIAVVGQLVPPSGGGWGKAPSAPVRQMVALIHAGRRRRDGLAPAGSAGSLQARRLRRGRRDDHCRSLVARLPR